MMSFITLSYFIPAPSFPFLSPPPDDEEDDDDDDDVDDEDYDDDEDDDDGLHPGVGFEEADGGIVDEIPFPQFPVVVLKYLHQRHPLRFFCLRLISNKYPFSFAFLWRMAWRGVAWRGVARGVARGVS